MVFGIFVTFVKPLSLLSWFVMFASVAPLICSFHYNCYFGIFCYICETPFPALCECSLSSWFVFFISGSKLRCKTDYLLHEIWPFCNSRTKISKSYIPKQKGFTDFLTKTKSPDSSFLYQLIKPTKYRPISLLSNFTRIFEKMMYKRMKSFLNKKEILNPSQYGFREKHSTQHAIIDIV